MSAAARTIRQARRFDKEMSLGPPFLGAADVFVERGPATVETKKKLERPP
jgi:hypothetical protein